MPNVPIITLKARIDEDDTLLGFELWAIVYTAKPYIPPFLLVRTNQLFHSRIVKKELFNYILSSTGIHVHLLLSIAIIEGKDINLTHTKLEVIHN